MSELEVGTKRVLERAFTVEEVEAFTRLSGDAGDQHTRPDPQGRRMVHGLLLASLPTEVGGSFNFLARELSFEFLRPAWTGERLKCTVVLTRVEPSARGTRLESSWECTNPAGELVMRGQGRGLVPVAA